MLWTVDHRSRTSLQDQIAGCVRRGITDGSLSVGEQLPPAAEVAEALSVDRNTVLAAYRQLREAGVLEFRRGRGARVAAATPRHPEIDDAARGLVALATTHGLRRADLIRLIEDLT